MLMPKRLKDCLNNLEVLRLVQGDPLTGYGLLRFEQSRPDQRIASYERRYVLAIVLICGLVPRTGQGGDTKCLHVKAIWEGVARAHIVISLCDQ